MKQQSRMRAGMAWHLEDEMQCWELGADGEYIKIQQAAAQEPTQGVQQRLLEKLA